jgi:flagellar hook-associated protein 1 FlgK
MSQSVSGVNLDDEAANLLQWQQAYQASAQALTIANSLFTSLLDSVNGTFT